MHCLEQVDIAKSLIIVDWTHPVLVSAVLQKNRQIIAALKYLLIGNSLLLPIDLTLHLFMFIQLLLLNNDFLGFLFPTSLEI